MAIEINDLESFHRFVGRQLENGGAQLSPEEVLIRWRERLATIQSVQRGLTDVKAGRTRPAKDVVRGLRRELQDDVHG